MRVSWRGSPCPPGGGPPGRAAGFFGKEGRQVRPVAEKEAKRGTSDPTYLVYTLGKLEIMKLREDYKKLKGPQYSLRGFHDAFLAQGFPPEVGRARWWLSV